MNFLRFDFRLCEKCAEKKKIMTSKLKSSVLFDFGQIPEQTFSLCRVWNSKWLDSNRRNPVLFDATKIVDAYLIHKNFNTVSKRQELHRFLFRFVHVVSRSCGKKIYENVSRAINIISNNIACSVIDWQELAFMPILLIKNWHNFFIIIFKLFSIWKIWDLANSLFRIK